MFLNVLLYLVLFYVIYRFDLSKLLCMRFFLQDAWSDSEGHVSLDTQQDYELIEAKQKPDGFYLLFKRPFNTCDPKDYLIEVRLYFTMCVCVCMLV